LAGHGLGAMQTQSQRRARARQGTNWLGLCVSVRICVCVCVRAHAYTCALCQATARPAMPVCALPCPGPPLRLCLHCSQTMPCQAMPCCAMFVHVRVHAFVRMCACACACACVCLHCLLAGWLAGLLACAHLCECVCVPAIVVARSSLYSIVSLLEAPAQTESYVWTAELFASGS